MLRFSCFQHSRKCFSILMDLFCKTEFPRNVCQAVTSDTRRLLKTFQKWSFTVFPINVSVCDLPHFPFLCKSHQGNTRISKAVTYNYSHVIFFVVFLKLEENLLFHITKLLCIFSSLNTHKVSLCLQQLLAHIEWGCKQNMLHNFLDWGRKFNR